MAISPRLARARARVASLERHHPNDAVALAAARRDLRVAKTEQAIEDLVAAAPAPTPEQASRLARLLYPSRLQAGGEPDAA